MAKFKELKIPQLKKATIKATIIGTQPLLTNALPVPLVPDLLRKQCGLPKMDIEKPTMEELYERSLYPHPDPNVEFGFPAFAIKKAMTRACAIVDDITMTSVKPALHVLGLMLPLRGTPQRLDTHERNHKKQVMAVTYALFPKGWEIDLTILYITKAITEESVLNLLYNAGIWSGLDRRRPECGGTNGMFEIKAAQSKDEE